MILNFVGYKIPSSIKVLCHGALVRYTQYLRIFSLWGPLETGVPDICSDPCACVPTPCLDSFKSKDHTPWESLAEKASWYSDMKELRICRSHMRTIQRDKWSWRADALIYTVSFVEPAVPKSRGLERKLCCPAADSSCRDVKEAVVGGGSWCQKVLLKDLSAYR